MLCPCHPPSALPVTLPVTSSGVRSTSGATQGNMEALEATPCAAARTIVTCGSRCQQEAVRSIWKHQHDLAGWLRRATVVRGVQQACGVVATEQRM
jgi:hypothetical protein